MHFKAGQTFFVTITVKYRCGTVENNQIKLVVHFGQMKKILLCKIGLKNSKNRG